MSSREMMYCEKHGEQSTLCRFCDAEQSELSGSQGQALPVTRDNQSEVIAKDIPSPANSAGPAPTPRTAFYIWWEAWRKKVLMPKEEETEAKSAAAAAWHFKEREAANLRHDIERAVATNTELATENEELRRQVEEAIAQRGTLAMWHDETGDHWTPLGEQLRQADNARVKAEAALAEERAKREAWQAQALAPYDNLDSLNKQNAIVAVHRHIDAALTSNEGKWCDYCQSSSHDDAECHSTRPVDWHPTRGRWVDKTLIVDAITAIERDTWSQKMKFGVADNLRKALAVPPQPNPEQPAGGKLVSEETIRSIARSVIEDHGMQLIHAMQRGDFEIKYGAGNLLALCEIFAKRLLAAAPEQP